MALRVFTIFLNIQVKSAKGKAREWDRTHLIFKLMSEEILRASNLHEIGIKRKTVFPPKEGRGCSLPHHGLIVYDVSHWNVL